MAGGNNIGHRGEQAWGILTEDAGEMFCYRHEGRFGEGVTERRAAMLAEKAKGRNGLAQALYSTRRKTGEKKQPKYMQPWMANFHGKKFGLVYNGNVYDLSSLRERARERGWRFQSDISDTEVIVALIATSEKTDFIEALKEVLPMLKGAFALILLYDGKLIGARGKFGIRPLCVGRNGDSFYLSSESCAFYAVGAKISRDVRPGEIVVVGDGSSGKYVRWAEEARCRICIFEFIYFARPDSELCCGKTARHYRNEAGIILAEEAPVDVDLIVSVPGGGDIFAKSYARKLGIPEDEGLFKNRYGLRTFMAPEGTDRRKLQRIKLHPLQEVIRGKRICLIEDSIVRNNVARETVLMCFEAGAKEVHMRVFSSPVIAPCYYGIDMSTREELAAANFSLEQIRERTGADSLAYLSLEGMIRATGLPKESLCMACFNGDYPVAPPTEKE